MEADKSSKIEPMPLTLVKSLIETHSPRLHGEIEEIDELCQTASLGQVHRANLKNGPRGRHQSSIPWCRRGTPSTVLPLRKAAAFGPPKKYQMAIEELSHYFETQVVKRLITP